MSRLILLIASSDGYHPAFDLEIWSIVVFTIILGVLLAFVAKPLAQAMGKRQEQTLEGLKQAEIALAESKRLIAEHADRQSRLRVEAEAMLEEAKRDAVRTKAEFVERAENEARRQQARSQRDINLLKQKALADIWDAAASASEQVAEKALRTRLSAGDHSQLVELAIADIGQTVETP